MSRRAPQSTHVTHRAGAQAQVHARMRERFAGAGRCLIGGNQGDIVPQTLAEYPSGLRGRIANPLFVGSNPTSAFS